MAKPIFMNALPWHLPAMKHTKTLANIFKWIPLKINMDFFYFLGVICRFSINTRISFFCLHWEMKGSGSLVNLLRFARFTRDQCPFISQCKEKSVLQSLIQGKNFDVLHFDYGPYQGQVISVKHVRIMVRIGKAEHDSKLVTSGPSLREIIGLQYWIGFNFPCSHQRHCYWLH